MAVKKRDVKLVTSSRIAAKILLLAVLYLAVLGAVYLLKDTVIRGYNAFESNPPLDVSEYPTYVFSTLFGAFAMFLGGLFIVNLVFRLIDEFMNDTVVWRRGLQIALNVLIILGGALYLLYLTYFQIPSQEWWEFSSLNTGSIPTSILLWGGAAAYLFFTILLCVLDLRVFAAESRKPGYRKNECKKQDAM